MSDLSEQLVEFYERLSSWEHAVVKESELSVQQMHTLEVLGHHGTLRMKDLAAKLGVVMGTLTVMINRLTDMGLVKRQANPEDKRSFQLLLTSKGRDIHKNHHKHHRAIADEITANLSNKEVTLFCSLLNKVKESL